MKRSHAALVLLACIAGGSPALAQRAVQPPAAGSAAQDFSPAERLLFMHKHLAGVKPPARLDYSFRHAGSLEPGFEDRVSLQLTAQADGACCAARTEFLSGSRRLELPDLPQAEGNPVLLFFLEHEVREMHRLTKGAQNHFRKRIRMAIFDGASVQPAALRYRGRLVPAREVRFSPYLNDPNRPRYAQLARKEYRFILSDAVPGGIAAIRSLVPAAEGGSLPLLSDELLAEGAEPVYSTGQTR